MNPKFEGVPMSEEFWDNKTAIKKECTKRYLTGKERHFAWEQMGAHLWCTMEEINHNKEIFFTAKFRMLPIGNYC